MSLSRPHTLTVRVYLDHAGCDALVTGHVHPEQGTSLYTVRYARALSDRSFDIETWHDEDPRHLHDADAETCEDALEDAALDAESYKSDRTVE